MQKRDVCVTVSLIVFQYPAVFSGIHAVLGLKFWLNYIDVNSGLMLYSEQKVSGRILPKEMEHN